MATNLEIEKSHAKRPIQEVAEELGIDPAVILPHGHHIAKIPLTGFNDLYGDEGALVLVTAMSPTPSGEGKTTTTIGLGDALRKRSVDLQGMGFLHPTRSWPVPSPKARWLFTTSTIITWGVAWPNSCVSATSRSRS